MVRRLGFTPIAQLIGRMVRTPLARSIDADEFLNTVALYLPHFDTPSLNRVVTELTATDRDYSTVVQVERGEDQVICHRNEATLACFEALKRVPSYVVPTVTKSNQVRRLLKLARLLEQDDLVPDASEDAKNLLLGVLREEHERLKDTETFQARLGATAALTLRAVALDYATGETTEVTSTVATSTENIDDVFDAAGRKLTEGLHKEYRRERVTTGGISSAQAKLELHGLVAEPVVMDRLQSVSKQQIKVWLEAHESSIEDLPEGHRQAYDAVRRLAGEPEKTALPQTDVITVRPSETQWDRHIFVDDSGTFPCTLNKWETPVMQEALADPNVEGWLRNLDRKQWSLVIPYDFHGEYHPVYPDFLVFRRVGDLLKVEFALTLTWCLWRMQRQKQQVWRDTQRSTEQLLDGLS